MAEVKVNIPANTNIDDPQIKQEVSQLKDQIRTVVASLNDLIARVEKLEGK